jgi:glycosyltransferase involved in cell wall biosynthesis
LAQLRHLDCTRGRYVIGIFDEQAPFPNEFADCARPLCPTSLLPEEISRLPQALIRIREIAKTHGVQVVCSHDYKSNFIGFFAARSLGLPHVTIFHGRTGCTGRVRAYERLDTFLLRRSQAVIAVSHASADTLYRNGVPYARIHHVPNGVEPPDPSHETVGAIRREFGLSASTPMIVYAGRLSPEKGLDTLVEAATQVLSRIPDSTFFCVGEGPEREFLKREVRRRHIESRVVFPGYRRDIDAFYQDMDIFVLPSRTEGMPLSLLEALARAKPVIATAVGGVPEVIDDGRTGVLIPPGNPDRLARSLLDLLADRERAALLGARGADLVRARYSAKAQTGSFLEIFRRVVDVHRTRRRRPDWIWITWEQHRRTRELCRDLAVPLFEKQHRGPRLLSHPLLALWTLATLARRRPRGLLIQNPSIILAWWALLLRSIFRYQLVVDTHNASIELLESSSAFRRAAARRIIGGADLTIVTNEALAKRVEESCGRAFVLPDRLPAFPAIRPAELPGARNVVCVTRFAADEPFREIIEAARLVGSDVTVYMTGNWRRVRLPDPLPANLVLTGFIPDHEYLRLLAAADVVLDLTNRDDCLVCGAYEAVALGQPLVLSDTPALRAYFARGCVYTDHAPGNIASAVLRALDAAGPLRREMSDFRTYLHEDWQHARRRLLDEMASMVPAGDRPISTRPSP